MSDGWGSLLDRRAAALRGSIDAVGGTRPADRHVQTAHAEDTGTGRTTARAVLGSDVRQAHGSGGQAITAGIARDLSELARNMQAEPDLAGVMQRLVHAALREIDGAAAAGISLIEQKRVHTEAATDDLVNRVDEAQYRLQQGPCLSSLREAQTVRSDDLATEERWPGFAAAALEQGVRSILSVQLFVEDDNLGALNLYAATPRAFDDADESTAMLLASHAAVAMKGHRVEQNLRTALVSRDVIGQAKGILMERYKINDTQAFDLLVMASQNTHRKLRDVADELTATGDFQLGHRGQRPHPPAER